MEPSGSLAVVGALSDCRSIPDGNVHQQWCRRGPNVFAATSDPARCQSYTAQPITSAFRGGAGSMSYSPMDGDKAAKLLMAGSSDDSDGDSLAADGWACTGGRHSVIVPLDDQGHLLSIGGKNNSIEGWSPENVSTNWGASWSQSVPSPFPPLGSATTFHDQAGGWQFIFREPDAYLFTVGRAHRHAGLEIWQRLLCGPFQPTRSLVDHQTDCRCNLPEP